MSKVSPFLDPGPHTAVGKLAIVHLSRDNLQPLILQETDSSSTGYAEGAVLNTRFGSFPHSTLIGVPWGSQIRASTVDTGSRGRKRKRALADEDGKDTTSAAGDEDSTADATGKSIQIKKAVTAASGFIHILPPTPELWTISLPHRTQVVYTPDYSYILQRICARPGTRLIEAGAGSGSFTHASARAVYNGYPTSSDDKGGKVFSFEFHRPRYEKMVEEIAAHGLEGIVQITHRDVYHDGFLVGGKSPEATAVFLDVPAPWEALPNLSRRRPPPNDDKSGEATDHEDEWISPLDSTRSAYICTFSPCIEQVTRTVSAMRSLGWVEIEMVELSHRRITVLRERTGFPSTLESTSNQAPANVAEAVARLKVIDQKLKDYNAAGRNGRTAEEPAVPVQMDLDEEETETTATNKGQVKPWLQGQLVHRDEAELKTHTSYLVFAVMPREWSEVDEASALAKWPCGSEMKVVGTLDRVTRKKEKREYHDGKKKTKATQPDTRRVPADQSAEP